MVVFTDRHQAGYPLHHFVATLSLAADILGPRHWTVHFMSGILLENALAMSENRMGRPDAIGRRIVMLTRLQLAWASDVAQEHRMTNVFLENIRQSVGALRALGLRQEAANLAAEVVEDYKTFFGAADEDAVNLVSYAADANGAFASSFDWRSWPAELQSLNLDPLEAAEVPRRKTVLRDFMSRRSLPAPPALDPECSIQ